MNFGKSGQRCLRLTYLSFLGQVLISLLISTQYSLVSTAVTNRGDEFTTEIIHEDLGTKPGDVTDKIGEFPDVGFLVNEGTGPGNEVTDKDIEVTEVTESIGEGPQVALLGSEVTDSTDEVTGSDNEVTEKIGDLPGGAALVGNDFTTEDQDTTESSIEEMDPKKKLVLDLIAENSNAEIFQDLVTATEQDFTIEEIDSYMGAHSFRVIHLIKTFIVKQHIYPTAEASEVLKIVTIEYKALEQRSQLQPGSVPRPYLMSAAHNCIVMEDYKDYVTLKSLLMSGQMTEETMKNIALALARLHNITLDKVDSLGQDFKTNTLTDILQKAKYSGLFSNETVEKLTNAGINMSAIQKLGNEDIIDKVNLLYSNITDNSTRQAVIHGLLVSNNIVILGDQVKFLGNQFAVVGHPGLDVAALLAQYLANYHVQMLTEQDNDTHRQIAYKMINASSILVDEYIREIIGIDEAKVKQFISTVAGFTGVELVCWAITEANIFTNAASAVLESGLRLIEAYHRIMSSDSLNNIALMLTT